MKSAFCTLVLVSVLQASLFESPAVAQHTPIGYVDNIDSNGTVYGWAKDPDAPNTAINVDVYADAIYAGRVLANYYHASYPVVRRPLLSIPVRGLTHTTLKAVFLSGHFLLVEHILASRHMLENNR